MTTELMDGIFRLQIPLPKNPLVELNAYLIRGKEGERSLLIDTGFCQEACREALFACLESLDVKMEETDILLTHLHSDHTGLMPEIVTDQTTVYISKPDRDWIDGDYRFDLEKQEDEKFLTAGFNPEIVAVASTTHPGRRFAPSPDFHRYTLVDDGDVLNVGGYRLELIMVPGHTPGQIVVWLEEQKAMFTADHVLFDITPNITGWPNLPDSLGEYIKSLKKVYSYPVKHVFPGHQEAGDFHKRIDELLVHHRERLDECLHIVEKNPGLVAHDIAGLMSWNIEARSWNDFPPAQKWFAVGECMSHLERLMAEEKVTSQEDGVLLRWFATS